MSVETIGLILIPVTLFMIGAIYGGIKGAVRFAQYMVRSEEAQLSTAASNQDISEQLDKFITEVRGELRDHGERLRIVEFAVLDERPKPKARAKAVET